MHMFGFWIFLIISYYFKRKVFRCTMLYFPSLNSDFDVNDQTLYDWMYTGLFLPSSDNYPISSALVATGMH